MPAIWTRTLSLSALQQQIQEQIHGTNLYRGNDVQGVAPSATEFPSPTEDDVAAVWLQDGTPEIWKYIAGAWSLQQTFGALPEYPDLHADFGSFLG